MSGANACFWSTRRPQLRRAAPFGDSGKILPPPPENLGQQGAQQPELANRVSPQFWKAGHHRPAGAHESAIPGLPLQATKAIFRNDSRTLRSQQRPSEYGDIIPYFRLLVNTILTKLGNTWLYSR